LPDISPLFISFTGDRDGAHPIAGPLVFDKAGALYGTTSGAPVNYGSVFKLLKKPDGWTEITLYHFTGGMDGGNPVASLLLRDSKLWGTTALGGEFGNGTAFKVGPDAPRMWAKTIGVPPIGLRHRKARKSRVP
jgi:hypothetical protein